MLPIITTHEALEALYKGREINSSWLIDSQFERDKYNALHREVEFEFSENGVVSKEKIVLQDPYAVNEEVLIEQGLEEWFIPDDYKDIDIKEFLLNKCKNDEEKERVLLELDKFIDMNLENVLRFLIYLIDVFRENKIVWGVGRGSSVSSLVLYLIGVHKIHPLVYDLPIEEFLR